MRVDQYLRTGEGFYLIRVREGFAGPLTEPVAERVRLSTFTAEVVEDVLIDDGAEERRVYVVSGWRLCAGLGRPARCRSKTSKSKEYSNGWRMLWREGAGATDSGYLAPGVLGVSNTTCVGMRRPIRAKQRRLVRYQPLE